MILLSVVMTGISQILFPTPQQDMMAVLQLTPFMAVAVFGGVTLAIGSAVVAVGRIFGGKGKLVEALLLIAWIDAMMIAIQLILFVCLAVLPPLAVLVWLGSLGLFLWLLVWFVAEMHRFESVGMALMTLVVAFVLASFVLVSLITSLGLVPPLETANV